MLASPARASPFARRSVTLHARAPLRVTPRPPTLQQGARAGIFDFLTPKASEESTSTDCGYIYKGDVTKESFFYKCPVCGVGKNRFKPAEEAGSYYKQIAAAKRAAKASKADGPERPRDKLKREAIERAKQQDSNKGSGKWF